MESTVYFYELKREVREGERYEEIGDKTLDIFYIPKTYLYFAWPFFITKVIFKLKHKFGVLKIVLHSMFSSHESPPHVYNYSLAILLVASYTLPTPEAVSGDLNWLE